jgi:hypothetical protein
MEGSAEVSAPVEASAPETEVSTESESTPSEKPQSSQPTKAELRELGAQDMDAMVTMKVNGKVQRLTVKEALKAAELGSGAHVKMQEAAKVRKEADRLLSLAKSDPDKFFEETGIDADQFAEQRLVRKYEKLAMTPEQRKLMETEEELKTYKEQESQTKQGYLDELKETLGTLPEGAEKTPKGAACPRRPARKTASKSRALKPG